MSIFCKNITEIFEMSILGVENKKVLLYGKLLKKQKKHVKIRFNKNFIFERKKQCHSHEKK